MPPRFSLLAAFLATVISRKRCSRWRSWPELGTIWGRRRRLPPTLGDNKENLQGKNSLALIALSALLLRAGAVYAQGVEA
jgi:hypothetical protein